MKNLLGTPLAVLASLFITTMATAAPIPIEQGSQLGQKKFADGDTPAGGNGQIVDGIEGSSHEMLKTHIHLHLALFYKGEQIAVPMGIGIVKPFNVNRGFVESGSGYYWLHTHDASGIIHVESPNDTVYTLGNFFDIWGQPLTAQNVAGLEGPVRIYVNGALVFAGIRNLALKQHDQITLMVGAPVVTPPVYVFPEGL